MEHEKRVKSLRRGSIVELGADEMQKSYDHTKASLKRLFTNKALLTSILCLFSRLIDGVTVKCNHIILEKEDKNCKSSLKILC